MDIIKTLSKVTVFAELDADPLNTLASYCRVLHLQTGQMLYQLNDCADHVYIIAYGRVKLTTASGLSTYLGRHDIVGEMGTISKQPHHGTVHAIRDTTLFAIPQQPFLDFIHQYPNVLLTLSRLIITRSQPDLQHTHAMSHNRTLSVIPATPQIPAIHLAEQLTEHLQRWPHVRLVTAAHVDALFGIGFSQTPLDYGADDLRLRQWLASLEEKHCYVLYAAHSHDDEWSKRCLHQADRILILAEANHSPVQTQLVDVLNQYDWQSPIELVLLRSEGDPSPHTLIWKQLYRARAHYFIHPWAQADISAVARQISSQGLGLVLGGGGARGFAHIGLIRALEQLHIPIDIVGGTSMGAFVAALVACGFDSVEMTHIAYETFVARNYLNDYTMPRVSLIRGQRFHSRLQAIFGHQRIEELKRTYYCISTNLSTGQAVIHDQGELATWVGTSMSVPGVAPPVAWHENLLCDGGVINNLPTDVMQNLERGTIIASNVSLHDDIRIPGIGLNEPDQSALLNWNKLIKDKLLPAPRLAEILMRTATLASDTMIQAAAIERANLHIRMPIEGIGMFDWHKLDELVERGYEHALATLLPIRDTLP
ncbi:patatin-like phospholipase family protein [Acinetobacter sp. NIPH 2699]|uniref:patatin-like phospholipase family protein n=1 Tax=Acinetobacter sp. NIPH 2699 TaxID=2923433 RepID=UPI001F4A56FA|nr:patatin-like phospholipase family protein [Acinetobacter sp. NIPH 2699]MCH7336295.1 patatin-like phospholipase family protein [Acinetobacter sp. NIPH 2699]